MATASVSAERVIRDGEKELARIRQVRIDRDEAKIRNVISNIKVKYGFLGRKKRDRTREEAIQYLDENSFWGWRSAWAQQEERRIKALILLAKVGDPLNLTHEDAHAIWG